MQQTNIEQRLATIVATFSVISVWPHSYFFLKKKKKNGMFLYG